MHNWWQQTLKNLECEKYILWAFRLDWKRFLDSWLDVSDFSDPIYQQILSLLIKHNGNETIVMWEIMGLPQEYIDAFAESTILPISDENIYNDALAVIKNNSKLRKQKSLAKKIIDGIDNGKWTENTLSIVNNIFELEDIERPDTDSITQEIVNEAMWYSSIKRFLTGYDKLDGLTWGYVPNQLITVGARPWRWKSLFAISSIINQLIKGYRVCLFSLEMSKKEIFQRLYANLWSLELNLIRGVYGREMTSEESKKFNASLTKREALKDKFIMYDDVYTLANIASKIRLLWAKKEVDIIYIDYLGLIEYKGETRNLEISKITRTLKILAMEYWIPIVILAQLNRWVDEEDEPTLSSLRDSWSIEQDSDIVLMLRRPDWETIMNIYVRKNRNWPCWVVDLSVVPQFMQLWNFTPPF